MTSFLAVLSWSLLHRIHSATSSIQTCAPAAAGRLIQDRSRKYRRRIRVDEGRDSRSVMLSPPYTAEKELVQERILVELRM